MKKLFIITLILLPTLFFLSHKSACADDEQCFASPIPTNEIVSPSPIVMPTCTPTPMSDTPSVVASPSAIQTTPDMTVIPTHVDTAASANNNAGQSATTQNYEGPTLYPEVGWK